ncbi:kinesin-like protein KIF20B [Labrus mixtus]|uniref:kinesin-like protein KIF20B n=1 Tax=Labrus mixtus TaxID=508554 RepID=UPI0029BFD16C|nr:kinesin-like protein KIF20B [Labrus mixtus]
MENNINSEGTEKTLYLTQIRYLEEQLERCQLKHDKLEKENQDLVSQHNAIENDKRDATNYLKRFVAAKEKKMDELDEQLEIQHLAAHQDGEILKLQHSHNVQELQEHIDKMNAEVTEQAAEIKEQREQLMQLEQTLSYMESLKAQLNCQREEHKAAMDNLKKNEVLMRQNKVEGLQNVTDKKIDEETSKVLKKELRWVEDQQTLVRDKEGLQKLTEVLRGRQSSICEERDEIQKHVEEITPKGLARKKEAQKLRKTCLRLTAELEDLNVDYFHQLASVEELKETLAALSEKNLQRADELVQLEAGLQTQRNGTLQLEGVKQEAAVILRHILEVKSQSQDSEKSSYTRWKMERLLDILESSAPQGKRSTLHSSPKPRTADLKPARKLCGQKTSSCENLSTPRPPRGADQDPETSTSAER